MQSARDKLAMAKESLDKCTKKKDKDRLLPKIEKLLEVL
jgi:hypothetical protein